MLYDQRNSGDRISTVRPEEQWGQWNSTDRGPEEQWGQWNSTDRGPEDILFVSSLPLHPKVDLVDRMA